MKRKTEDLTFPQKLQKVGLPLVGLSIVELPFPFSLLPISSRSEIYLLLDTNSFINLTSICKGLFQDRSHPDIYLQKRLFYFEPCVDSSEVVAKFFYDEKAIRYKDIELFYHYDAHCFHCGKDKERIPIIEFPCETIHSNAISLKINTEFLKPFDLNYFKKLKCFAIVKNRKIDSSFVATLWKLSNLEVVYFRGWGKLKSIEINEYYPLYSLHSITFSFNEFHHLLCILKTFSAKNIFPNVKNFVLLLNYYNWIETSQIDTFTSEIPTDNCVFPKLEYFHLKFPVDNNQHTGKTTSRYFKLAFHAFLSSPKLNHLSFKHYFPYHCSKPFENYSIKNLFSGLPLQFWHKITRLETFKLEYFPMEKYIFKTSQMKNLQEIIMLEECRSNWDHTFDGEFISLLAKHFRELRILKLMIGIPYANIEQFKTIDYFTLFEKLESVDIS